MLSQLCHIYRCSISVAFVLQNVLSYEIHRSAPDPILLRSRFVEINRHSPQVLVGALNIPCQEIKVYALVLSYIVHLVCTSHNTADNGRSRCIPSKQLIYN
uniref:Uncharacterized protein n=1 Tax=Anopheles arabiensis TaxID=7173 RepID=A0A182IHL9_ANOAR